MNKTFTINGVTFEYTASLATSIGELPIGDDGVETRRNAEVLMKMLLGIPLTAEDQNMIGYPRIMPNQAKGLKEDWKKCAHGVSTDEDCDGCKNIDFVIQKVPLQENTKQDE